MARGERAPKTFGGEEMLGSVMRIRGELLEAGIMDDYGRIGWMSCLPNHISQKAYR